METQPSDINNIISEHILQHTSDLIFVKDKSSRYLASSHILAKFCGRKSRKQMAGLSDFDMPWERFSAQYHSVDKVVLQDNTINTIEPIYDVDNHFMNIYVKKTPIKDEDSKVIGLIGFGRLLQSHYIHDSISTLGSNYDQYNFSNSLQIVKTFPNLTVRESECLYYFIRGNTCKEVARYLGISSRTIEFHLENIKRKTNCVSKVKLIEYVMKESLLNLIPSSLLNKVTH